MDDDLTNRRTALSAGCTAHVVQDGLTSAVYVLLPIFAQTFGFTYAQVGLLKGIMNIAQAVLEICSGWLSELVGVYRILALGLTLSGAGYLLVSAAPSAYLVTACLLVIGAGTALQHAPSSAIIATSYPITKRSGALGLYNASGDVGKLAFTGAISLATGAGLAWQQITFVYGLVAVLAATAIAIVARRLQHEWHRKKPEKHEAIDQPEVSGWGVLNWRSYCALLAATGIDGMVQTAVLVFTPFLMLSKGLSLSFATGATVLILAGGIFGKAGCGYLANQLGVRPAFVLIQTLTAVGLIAIIIVPGWYALALLLPFGAVLQGSSSITYGFAADLIDHGKMARGYALLYSSGTIASAAGSLAFGMVGDVFGIEFAMYVIAIVTLLAIPPIFVLNVTSAQPER